LGNQKIYASRFRPVVRRGLQGHGPPPFTSEGRAQFLRQKEENEKMKRRKRKIRKKERKKGGKLA